MKSVKRGEIQKKTRTVTLLNTKPFRKRSDDILMNNHLFSNDIINFTEGQQELRENTEDIKN